MRGEIGNLFHKTWIKGGQDPHEFLTHLVHSHVSRYGHYPKRIEINAADFQAWGISQVAGVRVEPSLTVMRNNFWVVHREAEEQD